MGTAGEGGAAWRQGDAGCLSLRYATCWIVGLDCIVARAACVPGKVRAETMKTGSTRANLGCAPSVPSLGQDQALGRYSFITNVNTILV